MSREEDKLAVLLRKSSQLLLVVSFGLLPIVFIPNIAVSLEQTKVMVVLFGTLLAVIMYSLSILRSGIIEFKVTTPVLALWGITFVSALSGLLAGDRFDSFVGNIFGVHTVMFLAVMALVATVMMLFNLKKESLMLAYVFLSSSALILVGYHMLRILFGPEFLSLGIFNNLVLSPFGGWNSLGIFFGLTILLSMVALEQLPLTKPGRIFFAVVTTLSLMMLVVINFIAVWYVLGVVSLVILMYSLVKDRFSEADLFGATKSQFSLISLAISGATFLVSVVAILGGQPFGGYISNISGVNFVEVRPSLEATVDIAQSVYQENALLGVGSNRFADAWRLHKDQSINLTNFWNTDFSAGYSYISTAFVNNGILGGLMWLIFFGSFIYFGFRMIFSPRFTDKIWNFIGVSSFVASIYLWGMSLIYTPSSATLLLAVFFTGSACLAYNAQMQVKPWRFSLAENKRAAIVLVGVVMIVLIGSVAIMFSASRHYTAVITFNNAINNFGAEGSTIESIEAEISSAYDLSENDIFARQIAEYEFQKISLLLTVTEPTELQFRELETSVARGVQAIRLALAKDPTEPRNWLVAGAIYSALVGLPNLEGVAEEAATAFAEAIKLDPVNPLYGVFQAQLSVRAGDTAGARDSLTRSVELKPDYITALLNLAELEVFEGNIDAAISRTTSVIALNPNNPARHYQLGVLETTNDNIQGAIVAFRQAIQLDPNYANARFLLARLYGVAGEIDAALEQLRVVSELNPDNEEVKALITALESGEVIDGVEVPTGEVELPESNDDGEVVSTTETSDVEESDLLSPVNVGTDSSE